jgi:hypothetical protein
MADECPARPDRDPPAVANASARRHLTTNLTNGTNEGLDDGGHRIGRSIRAFGALPKLTIGSSGS